MTERVVRFVNANSMLLPGDRVAAAVSGGADSVALLEVLVCLRRRLQVEVAVAHFNHRLRGAESDADARFVEELAARHGVPFYSGSGDVAAEAARRRGNLESVARDLRYGFLRGLVESGQVRKVATGHTADDQAETMLGRLLRGSGTRGLAGIYPVVNGWLIRPLLDERRVALRAWLGARDRRWREDASNRDPRFLRTRLRREVMPLLEKENPRLVENLAAAAGVARDEEQFWTRHSADLLSRLATPAPNAEGPDSARVLKLSLGDFVQLSRAEQRRLLRAAVARMGFSGLNLEQVDALCQMALGQSGRRLKLPERSGLEAVRVFDRLELRDTRGRRSRTPSSFEYAVLVPGECTIPATGTRLRFNLVGRERPETGYNLDEHPLIALDLIENPLMVRNWRPGDTFDSPTGRGRRKIKTLLLERRVPAGERRLWPVVVSQGQVVWMRGFPVARRFRAGPGSGAGILVEENVLEAEGVEDGEA